MDESEYVSSYNAYYQSRSVGQMRTKVVRLESTFGDDESTVCDIVAIDLSAPVSYLAVSYT